MAASLRTLISLKLNPVLTDALGSFSPLVELLTTMQNGTGENLCDLVYAKQRTIANTGTPDTVDLAGGLLMPNGDACVFAKIKALFVLNQSAAQILTVGAGSNPWLTWLLATGDAVKVGKSGALVLYNPVDGYVVTAGTGDILTVTSDGGTNINYSLLIAGTSA